MRVRNVRWWPARWVGGTLLLLGAGAALVRAAAISETDLRTLRESFELCLKKEKGPYTDNLCVCDDGAIEPVAMPDGKTVREAPCGERGVIFCSAFRAPWAEELARRGVYLGNIFSRDVYHWPDFADHHALVRGYILEHYFTETHPEHVFAQLRAYGGLSGTENEAPDAQDFFERYLALPGWSDFRHYLLSYEIQRRFFLRPDLVQIRLVRDLAVQIERAHPSFKLICDAIHNRVSPTHIEKVVAFRDALPHTADRTACNELIAELEKLTRVGESDLAPQIEFLVDAPLRTRLLDLLPSRSLAPLPAIRSVAAMWAAARDAVAERRVAPREARKLVDLAISASAVVHARTTSLIEQGGPRTVRESLELLRALTDATYGAGLLSRRERDAAVGHLERLLAGAALDHAGFHAELRRAMRVVEWAQNSVRFAFDETMPAWSGLLPDVVFLADDILRASPLLVYAQVAGRLEEHVARDLELRHAILGASIADGVRALNPGLAVGPLRFAAKEGGYTREDVVALLETPAELQPTAGILTQGEGNVVSHVQLLARSLGIPNVVFEPELMKRLAAYDGKYVFLMATPMGRVFLKEISRMTEREHEIYAEYTRNRKRSGDGRLGAGAGKLQIDRGRLDLSDRTPVDLRALGRRDSGVRSGPKAAFLGELKRLFPSSVSRGVVLPFGVYYEHYRRAVVHLPDGLRRANLARPGEPLHTFVERTYDEFFGTRMRSQKITETQLAAWIQPRLEVIRHSLRSTPVTPALREALRAELERQGLLLDASGRMVGCFVRSDTNVEDQPNFNGAGLNLTIFNVTSFEKLLDGIKEVWASPFSYRSFSWRQTLIDEPLWVLPSIVVQESVPSEKSGVLITADVETGDPSRMTIGTSEGVGGAVDGSPAETLLWSPHGVELLAQFKASRTRLLKPEGGVEIVPATGRERVLEPAEIEQLVAAARTITASLEPERDTWGKPRPWDVEYGFVDGKLWLFQVRAFVGNDEIRNIPALRALDRPGPAATQPISLDEPLR